MRARVAFILAVAVALGAPAAMAHKGSPNYLSQIKAVTPATQGLTFQMLNRDDSLLLKNKSGKDVVIEGYNGEPYVRVLADGTVQVNTDSPAYYLNEERFGGVSAPEGVDGKGEPRWKDISTTGQFEWHDHRAHYMGKGIPQQVTDKDKRSKVFDWKVPLEVSGTKGTIAGTLFWTPTGGGGAPVGAIIVGALLVIGLSAIVVVVRRRRAAGETGAEGAEAW